MFDYDKWHEIFLTLRKNKLRAFLTMFGVFWGIFMLIILMGSGNGLRNGVNREFSGWATNSGFMWSNRTTMPYDGLQPGRRIKFTNEDANALRTKVKNLQELAPRVILSMRSAGNNVVRGNKSGAFRVFGDYPEYQKIQIVDMVKGRHLNELDIKEKRKVAVIGNHIAKILFDKNENPIGQYIKVNNIYFQVIGVFKSKRRAEKADRDEQTVYLPFTTFQKAFNYGNRVNWFAFTARPGVKVSQLEKDMVTLIKRRHHINPEDKTAIETENLEEEFGKVSRLFNGINIFVWIVGIGTLLAGVIGVSNIMLIIVKERTKEIGIRKSLGATPWSIIAMIVQESTFVTLIAGYVGVFMGILILAAVSYAIEMMGASDMMFMNPGIRWQTALVSLIILVISGILAGLIPAGKAVKVNPIEALHAE